ncbi:LysE family translocator [Dietzia cinnamea]|uniref:LysE family translocator n=4 Tax=Dietzia TaxID=37914 RepID=UPI0007BB4B8C|nr:LysE family translocator [Dietzia cinnamea]KZO60234.1 lysine transporter LysE [Dietzia maris]MCT2061326.1 LysE family translocator [Dietzia cinnamea]MCT2097383.1 LysE family translocator [Dietzia cinnamea]MCT2235340.1 LysE family translocator [Dietzia cinnamea]MCT2300729.1 LysE family translocator [Dietzia cinnamea]
MTAAQLLGLFGVWAIAVVSPGPDVVVVLQRALAGRRHGVATALGIVAGLTVWLGAAFAGVATLVRVYPQVMTVLQVAGGLLLATLGVLGLHGWWRSRSTPTTPAAPMTPAAYTSPAPQNPLPGIEIRYRDRSSGSRLGVADLVRRDVARGLATNLANPKALVFFGAVLTPFLRDEVSVAWSVALVAGMLAVALAWFAGLAVVASHRAVNERVGRLLPWVDLVASALFVAVGVAFVIAALV